MKMPTHKIITSDVGKLWGRRQPAPFSMQSITLIPSACQVKGEILKSQYPAESYAEFDEEPLDQNNL